MTQLSEYDNIHYRVKAKQGKPSLCDFCGSTEATMYHWAHRHESSWEPERENWYRLCVKCHSDYDDRGPAVAQANQNRLWTNEMRQHMSDIKSGDGNGFFGKTHSDETKQILGEVQRRLRKECECGLSTNPGNLARHISRTGHKEKK